MTLFLVAANEHAIVCGISYNFRVNFNPQELNSFVVMIPESGRGTWLSLDTDFGGLHRRQHDICEELGRRRGSQVQRCSPQVRVLLKNLIYYYFLTFSFIISFLSSSILCLLFIFSLSRPK